MKRTWIVCSEFEPGTANWNAQTIPLDYGHLLIGQISLATSNYASKSRKLKWCQVWQKSFKVLIPPSTRWRLPSTSLTSPATANWTTWSSAEWWTRGRRIPAASQIRVARRRQQPRPRDKNRLENIQLCGCLFHVCKVI